MSTIQIQFFSSSIRFSINCISFVVLSSSSLSLHNSSLTSSFSLFISFLLQNNWSPMVSLLLYIPPFVLAVQSSVAGIFIFSLLISLPSVSLPTYLPTQSRVFSPYSLFAFYSLSPRIISFRRSQSPFLFTIFQYTI